MSDELPPEPIIGEPELNPATEIARLAKLSRVDYDRQRKAAADALGIRPVTLDAEVAQARGGDELDNGPVEVVEPWTEEVDGAVLANTIRKILHRHVLLPDGAAEIVALWCLGSSCYNAFRLFPKLLISSPEKRCGKTTLLEIIEAVCRSAVLASNVTPAVLFRLVDAYKPTLLFDEADRWLKDADELIGIINAGHTRRSAFVWRTVGDEHTPTKFSVWGAMAIAGIKTPADTIVDRSIEIEMRRKAPGERRERLPANLYEACLPIRQKCARWAIDNLEDLSTADPVVPSVGNDRAEDNWRVLLTIAEAVGWYDTVRDIFKKAYLNRAPDDVATTILLADIRDQLKDRARIYSDDLVNALTKLDDRPWSEWRQGKPITQNGLARLLKPFKVTSKDLRTGVTVRKGYESADFDDAFLRYLPAADYPTATTLQATEYAASSDFQSATQTEPVADAKAAQASNGAGCSGVADGTPSKPTKREIRI